MFVEKRQVVIGIPGKLLRGQVQAGVFQHLVGQALVLAQRHAHGAGQVTQGLAATHAPAAVDQGEQTGFGVIDLNLDAATMRFVDNDPRVGIELGLRAGAKE
ncbi:hypothetical protein D3C73_988180 [compost metagenome]